MGRPLRAIIVDDSPALLKSASRLMSALPTIELIGQATTGDEAIAIVEKLRPDLVLMDIRMPGIDGLEATRRIVSRECAPKVIIMSVYEQTEYKRAAEEAGAIHFIPKASLVDQLPILIRELIASTQSADNESAPSDDGSGG